MDMDTLLVFLIVFVPMGWLLWRMLRHTRDTIGSNSPMKVQRIYRTRFLSFFARSDYLFVLMGVTMFAVGMSAVFFARFSEPYPDLGRAIMFLISWVSLGVPAIILVVDLNHWPYAKNVVITTFPHQHQLEIKLADAVLRLKQGDIAKIQTFHNNGKLQLGFAVFYLTSGEQFILSFKTEGFWVIQEYFNSVPVEYCDRFIPVVAKGQKNSLMVKPEG